MGMMAIANMKKGMGNGSKFDVAVRMSNRTSLPTIAPHPDSPENYWDAIPNY